MPLLTTTTAGITWTVTGRSADEKPLLTDKVSFTCTLASDVKPSRFHWKSDASSSRYRYGVLYTGESGVYTSVKDSTLSQVFKKEIACRAKFAKTFEPLYSKIDFEPALDCPQLDARSL